MKPRRVSAAVASLVDNGVASSRKDDYERARADVKLRDLPRRPAAGE
jgi:hypothetical protein